MPIFCLLLMSFLHRTARPMGWVSLALCAGLAHADMYSDVERMVSSGQLARAQSASAEHLQQHPSDPQMRLLSSRILQAQGRSDAALQVLESLRTEFPELPEPHNNLAVLYARSGRTQEALESLNHALLARPDYSAALENLGDLHLHLALQAYRRIQPDEAAQMGTNTKIEAITPLLRP